MLDDFGDDAGAASGGVRDIDGAVGKLDDGGGDGGEWAFEGLDVVCGGGAVAECIGCVGDAEVYGKGKVSRCSAAKKRYVTY